MTTNPPELVPQADPAAGEAPVRGGATAFTDYFSVLGARFFSVVLSMATVVMSSRILGPTGYAVIAYVSLISALIFAISSAWNAAAVPRYGREALETGESVTAITWARAAMAGPLLGACVLAMACLKLVGALPAMLTWTFVILAIATGILTVTAEHTIAMVEVDARMKLSALWIVLGQVLVAIGLVVITVSGDGRTALTVVVLIVCSQLLVTGGLARRCWNALWPPSFDPVVRARMLAFSVPLIAFTASQYVVSSVDIVVIGAFRTTADVGRYALAYRGYTVLQTLALASGPVLTPLFVSLKVAGKEGLVRDFVDRTVAQMTTAGAVLTGLAALLVHPVILLLAGHRFAGAVTPLVILVVGNVAFFMANLLGAVLVLYERTRPIALINLGAAVVNLVGDVLLIGVFGVGIVAAAIATLGAVVVVWVGYWLLARDTVGLRGHVNPLVIAPAVVGAAAALNGGVVADAAGAVGTVLAGVMVLRYGGFLSAQDAQLLSRLDVPPTLRRAGQRLITLVAR